VAVVVEPLKIITQLVLLDVVEVQVAELLEQLLNNKVARQYLIKDFQAVVQQKDGAAQVQVAAQALQAATVLLALVAQLVHQAAAVLRLLSLDLVYFEQVAVAAAILIKQLV